jgi:hypothetical protein
MPAVNPWQLHTLYIRSAKSVSLSLLVTIHAVHTHTFIVSVHVGGIFAAYSEGCTVPRCASAETDAPEFSVNATSGLRQAPFPCELLSRVTQSQIQPYSTVVSARRSTQPHCCPTAKSAADSAANSVADPEGELTKHTSFLDIKAANPVCHHI